MKRRGFTLLLGAVLSVLVIWQISLADVPYVALGPGPTQDTLTKPESSKAVPNPPDVIQITGAPTSASKGQLLLVTVSVHTETGLVEAIRGWLSGEEAVIPRDIYYPPGRSEEEVEEQNKQDFTNSQSSAETSALRELGYDVRVTIKEITVGGPADGVLKVDDVIKKVDGTPVTSTQTLIELIQRKPAGTKLQIEYSRAGVDANTEITTKPASEKDSSPRIGVSAKNEQPHPFTMKIELDKIGGPSAGMMFALGIIDKVKPEDLTSGHVIAGTGTIDDEGNVGPIGGIAQKLHGAKRDGATVFLVPADNCTEAKQNAVDGLRMVKVGTLDEALAALEQLAKGGPLPSC